MILLIIVLSSITLNAQDRLIYNGKTIYIKENPLKNISSFDSLRVRLFGDKKITSKIFSNWDDYRGYATEWKIIDKELYLIGIYDDFRDRNHVANLKELFGYKCINGKVKADWFSGAIYCTLGKLLYRDECGVMIIYEVFDFEKMLRFKSGELCEIKILDNTKTCLSDFSYKKLDEFISSSINWSILPKDIDKRTFVNIHFSANEKGKIDMVEIPNNRFNNQVPMVFKQEAIRVIKSIPKWDIIYLHGVHKRKISYINIDFSEESLKRNVKK